jgi:hypothetical protein
VLGYPRVGGISAATGVAVRKVFVAALSVPFCNVLADASFLRRGARHSFAVGNYLASTALPSKRLS